MCPEIKFVKRALTVRKKSEKLASSTIDDGKET